MNQVDLNIKKLMEKIDCYVIERFASSFITLCDVNDSDCPEDLKQMCLERLVEKTVWFIETNCTVELLYHVASCLEEQPEEHVSKYKSFTREILNRPEVVESYKSTQSSYIHQVYMAKIANYIEDLFTPETALIILQSNPDRNIFILFGYHPVLLKHVELQKKWICYYSEYNMIEPLFGIRHITDEALLSVPTDDAFNFIKKFFIPWYARYVIWHMLHFRLETVKRIAFMHIVTHGMNKDSKNVLECIRKFERLQL